MASLIDKGFLYIAQPPLYRLQRGNAKAVYLKDDPALEAYCVDAALRDSVFTQHDGVERGGLDRFKAHAYLNFGNAINPWTRHVRTSLDLLQTALNAANQRGHLTFAAYSYTQLIAAHLVAGDPLNEVEKFADSGLAFVQQTGFGTGVDLILGHLGLIRALRGLTPDLSLFNHGEFDETQFEQHVAADTGLAMSACWYWIRKLQAHYLAGDQVSAASAALKAEGLLWTSPGFLVVADYHFYAALVRASHYGAP